METIMVTGGLGFTGRHITKRLAVGGHCVVSYNRDFAPCSHRTDRRRSNVSSAGEPVGASGPQDRM
jgi:nucleoside-diphosphate-sugar epimerase